MRSNMTWHLISRTVGISILVMASLTPLAGQDKAKNPGADSKPAPSIRELMAAAPKGWVAPKTAWGDPDLQGLWSYGTLTPLERPASIGDKAQMTPEEIAEREREALDVTTRGVGSYDRVWYDPGQSDGRTALIVDPPNGRRPPMTPEGIQRNEAKRKYQREHPADTWEDLALGVRCISYHGVPPLPTLYGNTYQIFQMPGYVAMYDEELTGTRRIPTDGRPHPSKAVGLWNGDSRGRWEGNTLVVETTNFRPDAGGAGFGGGVMGSSNMPTYRVVERFTRIAPDVIELRFTIDDPATYTAPWTAVLNMPRSTDGAIYEYACHEGNHSLPAILAGARAAEKEGKQVRPVGVE